MEANKEIAREPPLRPRGGLGRRRDQALRVQGREVQGGDHRGHRRQGRQDADPLPPRRLGRLLPRAPRAVDREDRRDQAAQHQRSVLARRPPQSDAPAHLRHGLLRQEGPRRLAEAAGGGKEARPPEARPRARPLRVLPRGAGRRVLEPQGHGPLPGAGGPDAPLDPRERVPGDQDPAALQQGALGEERPLGQVPGQHVPGARQRDRRARLQPEADELPLAPPVLRLPEAQLSRAAAAVLDAGRAAPERGLRKSQRTHPRPAVRPGRRAHLLHRGAARGRGEALHPAPGQGVRRVRADLRREVRHPAAAAHRRRRALGSGRGRAGVGAEVDGDRVRAEPRRRRLLRARSSTST